MKLIQRLLTITHGNQCADGEGNVHRVICTGDFDFFALFAN